MRGIEHARTTDCRGQEGGLRRRHIASGLVKIRSRGSLGAVDAVAPLNYVQVELEDALLGQLRFETPCDQELTEFSNRILRGRQVQILRQLLRDGAAAAGKLHPLQV